MKNPGKLVITSTGKKGIAYRADKPINGKIVVSLINDDFSPVIENGKHKKILCNAETLQLNGFVD